MAFIHVAIPLNITGLQYQTKALDSHLQKIANSSSSNIKNLIFTKQIIDISNFARHRLSEISDEFFLIDNILPVPLEDDRLERFIRNSENFNETESVSAFMQDFKNFTSNLIQDIERQMPVTKNAPKIHQRFKRLAYFYVRQPEESWYTNYQNKQIRDRNYIENRLDRNLKHIKKLQQEIKELHEIHFPSDLQHLISPLQRKKRFVVAAIALIAGTLGTFLGLYNAYEMTKLQSQLNSMAAKHNLLVLASKQHEEQIQKINYEMGQLLELISQMTIHNPALISAKIDEQLTILKNKIIKLTNVIQELQHHRLSVDLLSFTQLNSLHASVQQAAKANGYESLTTQLADYFQLETSYLRKNADIIILLHVPCTKKDNLLNIYRYVPFPFPLKETFNSNTRSITNALNFSLSDSSSPQPTPQPATALFLVPESELIAVGPKGKFMILSQADFTHCTQKSRMFLCERHQVLHKNLQDSCLGSLFLRSETGVKLNCKFETRPLRETVYQINANEHLVFTPYPLTTQITCSNGTHYPVFLAATSKLIVPNGCQTELNAHTIQSDFNIRVTPAAIHFSWQVDFSSFPANLLLDANKIDQQILKLAEQISKLQNTSIPVHKFDEMLTNSFSDPSSIPMIIWLSVSISLFLVSLICGWCIYSRWQTRKYWQQQQEMELHPLDRAIDNINRAEAAK